MLGVCGERCYIELGKNDIDAGVYVDENGVGSVAFKNKNSEDATDYPVELRFINTENVDKLISVLNDLKDKMSKENKTKICDTCNTKITEKEFKNNDGYCHNCFTKRHEK